MPQAHPDLAAQWPGYDEQAIAHLKAAGLTYNRAYEWTVPVGYVLTERDASAIDYLADEWDWGGISTQAGTP